MLTAHLKEQTSWHHSGGMGRSSAWVWDQHPQLGAETGSA